MKSAVLMLTGLLFIFLITQSFHLWKNGMSLKIKNQSAQNELKKFEGEYRFLDSQTDGTIGTIEDNYKNIDKQIRLFSRFHNLKVSVEEEKRDRNRVGMVQDARSVVWPGINQMSVYLNFYDLKEVEQQIKVMGFIEEMEAAYPLKVLRLNQSGHHLQVGIQIYGGGV